MIRHGKKTSATIRLIVTPLASARPRSGPILYFIRHSAMKPIMVVNPLDTSEDVLRHSASVIAEFLSAQVLRHSV